MTEQAFLGRASMFAQVARRRRVRVAERASIDGPDELRRRREECRAALAAADAQALARQIIR